VKLVELYPGWGFVGELFNCERPQECHRFLLALVEMADVVWFALFNRVLGGQADIPGLDIVGPLVQGIVFEATIGCKHRVLRRFFGESGSKE
jgi:hypothetical protein